MTLSFRLLPQYYELVKSGKKYMEFRSITDYYVKKLMGGVAFDSEEELQKFVGELRDKKQRDKAMKSSGSYFRCDSGHANDYDRIRFFNKDGESMVFELKKIDFSANDNTMFVLTLGKRING